MAGFSQMNDSERIKFCDTLGVTNRYTGYRHNLNRGNLDPVRIGYAWLDQEPNQPPQPKWTPEPKWTPPSCQPDPICNTEPTSCAQLKCDFKNVLKPGPTNLQKSDPPCECDTTFKPLPKLIPQIGCDDVNGIIASPDPRPKSQPESVTPATCSLYVTKCVPVARQKSNEKANVPEFTQQFHYEYERPQVDLCEYIRKPRQQCYIRNGGGRKADLETWVPPQLPSNSFKPHRPLCRPGYNKRTVRLINPRPTEGLVETLHVRQSGVNMKKGPTTATIQERCGINTKFPGTTEYKDRYQPPKIPTRTLEFKINPTLDFSIYGRPLDKRGKIPKITEYQYRYEWPDRFKIRPLPWLRV